MNEFDNQLKRLESRFIKISRDRYVEILEKIEKIKGPRIQIRTAELANVVIGAENTQLPSWVHDKAIDQELYDLIENNKYVWICPICDSIVSFYNDESSSFVIEALKVYTDYPIPCPYCGECKFALWNPQSLKRGVPVPAPPVDAFVAPNEQNAKSRQKYSVSEDTCRRDESVGEKTDINEECLDKLLQEKNKEEESTPTSRMRFLNEIIDLTPQMSKDGFNILGIVWDGVRLTIQDKYQAYKNVAVGMSKTTSMTAFFRQCPNGGMAIAVEFGLIAKLLFLNRLVGYLHGNGDKYWSWRDIVQNMVLAISDGQFKHINVQIHPKTLDERDGSRDESFKRHMKAYISTTKQLRFIMLHELGHLILGQNENITSSESLEHENKIDKWVVNLILSGGDEFDEPWNDKTWLQWQATFWLFEYWHIMHKMIKQSSMECSNARWRWDNIQVLLQRKGGDLAGVHANDARRIIDTILEKG